MISSIRANELEGFVDGSYTCPPSFFTNSGPNGTTINTLNHEYQIWQKQDHILLSWLLSSLSEGVLGTVVDCYTSESVRGVVIPELQQLRLFLGPVVRKLGFPADILSQNF